MVGAGFNTASGKHCCNGTNDGRSVMTFIIVMVSIPQAVSTVATFNTIAVENELNPVSIPQAVSTVATAQELGYKGRSEGEKFQYRKR